MALTTLTYGFMFGVGIALAYAPPMGVVTIFRVKVGECHLMIYRSL